MTDCMRGSIGALAEQPVVFEGEQPGRVLELAGHAGVLLLANGAEIVRVQETMIRLLRAFGVTNSNVYVISNGIFATVNEGSAQALSLVRHVPLGSVNLARIDQVNQISRSVCAGELGLEAAEALGATVYHAGTRREGDGYVTAGGRVLGVTALGDTLREAVDHAYAAARCVYFDDMHMRTDIGSREI